MVVYYADRIGNGPPPGSARTEAPRDVAIHQADPTGSPVFAARDNEGSGQRALDGRYVFDVTVNDIPMQMRYDDDVPLVTVRAEDALRLGISFGRLDFSAKIKTAKGLIDVAGITINTMTIGRITVPAGSGIRDQARRVGRQHSGPFVSRPAGGLSGRNQSFDFDRPAGPERSPVVSGAQHGLIPGGGNTDLPSHDTSWPASTLADAHIFVSLPDCPQQNLAPGFSSQFSASRRPSIGIGDEPLPRNLQRRTPHQKRRRGACPHHRAQDRMPQTSRRRPGGELRAANSGAGRFFANKKVTVERIVAGWSDRTVSAVAGRHVLAIQDTTEVSIATRPRRRRGLGQWGHGNADGVLAHAMLAVDAVSDACLGLLGVTGYFAYHAVPTNIQALKTFRFCDVGLWRRTLLRRGKRDRTTWERMTRIADDHLPRPRIIHPWPSQPSASNTQGGSRMRECRSVAGSVRVTRGDARPYRDLCTRTLPK